MNSAYCHTENAPAMCVRSHDVFAAALKKYFSRIGFLLYLCLRHYRSAMPRNGMIYCTINKKINIA